jgi:1,4-dihydroxy-2-naphthoate octaprenyltransferase
VLVFFGFVATVGSAYVQAERVPTAAWWGAVAVGLLACAILLANNIRDIDTDGAVGKRTLPVLVGAPAARVLYAGCVAGAFAAVVAVGVLFPTALIALAAVPLAVRPVRVVATRRDPPSLVGALVATARLELVVAVLLSLGLITS